MGHQGARGACVNQCTIAEKISCTGIGLHSGAPVQLSLHPARADSGIVFVRTDLNPPVEIQAKPASLYSTTLATTLGDEHASVGTVEHLMAALYGLGIDNVRIELDGPEIPIMDGSAASFVFLLRLAGVFEQRAERRVYRVATPIEVRDGDRWIRIKPGRGLTADYAVDFPHPAIGQQHIRSLEITPESFEQSICRARTFGFLHEVEALWKAGLAQGGSLENTIVLDHNRVLNQDGLRYADEFVRHKVLDLLGDLALLGIRVEGRIQAHRAGHALHQKLVAELASRLWESEDFSAPSFSMAEVQPVAVPA